VCPAADATGVAEVLLTAFDSRNKIMDLLKAVIQKEVNSAGKLFIFIFFVYEANEHSLP
jgi:hypothetical protein